MAGAILRLCVGAALALGGVARAMPPASLPPLYAPPLPKPADRPTTSFPSGVRMFGDLTYAERVGYRPLKLDLYLPPAQASSGPVPLVLWFHGGGYEIGNPRADWTYGDWTQVLARLAARGYAVAGVSYRFNREAPFPAQLEDARAALAFLREHHATWGIDPARAYAWGLSAGGHLALMLALTSGPASEGGAVQGIADWFGPTDFATFDRPDSPATVASLLRCPDGKCPAEAVAAASPINFAGAGSPPVLIVHGTADTLVSVSQGDALDRKLRAAGARVTYRRLDGLGHGFTGASPKQLADILDQTFAFFDDLRAGGAAR